MTVILKYGDGSVYSWTFPCANDLNKFISALDENSTPGWSVIEITITKLGPNLAAK